MDKPRAYVTLVASNIGLLMRLVGMPNQQPVHDSFFIHIKWNCNRIIWLGPWFQLHLPFIHFLSHADTSSEPATETKSSSHSTMELDSQYDHYDYPTADPEACEGHIGHLTSAQQAKLQDLRSALVQEGHTSRLDTLTLVGCPIHAKIKRRWISSPQSRRRPEMRRSLSNHIWQLRFLRARSFDLTASKKM